MIKWIFICKEFYKFSSLAIHFFLYWKKRDLREWWHWQRSGLAWCLRGKLQKVLEQNYYLWYWLKRLTRSIGNSRLVIRLDGGLLKKFLPVEATWNFWRLFVDKLLFVVERTAASSMNMLNDLLKLRSGLLEFCKRVRSWLLNFT